MAVRVLLVEACASAADGGTRWVCVWASMASGVGDVGDGHGGWEGGWRDGGKDWWVRQTGLKMRLSRRCGCGCGRGRG